MIGSRLGQDELLLVRSFLGTLSPKPSWNKHKDSTPAAVETS